MRRVLRAGVAVTAIGLITSVLVPLPACAFDTGSGTNTGSGYALSLTALANIDAATGTRHDVGGMHYLYMTMPACSHNDPVDDDGMCGAAKADPRCTTASQPNALMDFVYRGISADDLSYVGTVCMTPADVVDPRQLQQDIDIEVTRLLKLAPPTIASAPPVRFLTNLPSDFWATGPAGSQTTPKTVSVAIDDVAVTLTATATWSWDFDDGTEPTASRTAGVPYDPAEDPRATPAYYTVDGVLHTYRAAGDYRPRLTVTWSPSYRLTYQFGSWDRSPVAYTAVKPITVVDAHAVLTAGG